MKKLTLLLATFYVLNVSAQSSANFTFKMLQQLEGEKDKKSVFISPYSIRTILSLCAEGAKGKTASEMFESLSLPTESEQRRKEMQATIGQLHQAKGFELLTTNTIWINKTLALLKSFSQIGETYYNSLTKSIGFSENAEKARKTINNFVAEKTKQMIKNLLPEGVITKETQMVLTNTIYFKADWEKNFDKKNTQEKDFWLTSTEKKKTKMMYQKNRFSGGVYENHKVLALPYKGGEVRMWIVLPENKDLPALIKKMNPQMWQSLKSAAYNQEVLLTLPLFEFETKYKLKENLKGLGMNMAFSDAAEFGNISANTSLKISEVIHQAKIKVEEKGTEAAAATAVVVNVTSSGIRNEMPPPPLVFTADHPFLFVIEYIATQEILFAGTMLDPTKQ
jgi:serpin B